VHASVPVGPRGISSLTVLKISKVLIEPANVTRRRLPIRIKMIATVKQLKESIVQMKTQR